VSGRGSARQVCPYKPAPAFEPAPGAFSWRLCDKIEDKPALASAKEMKRGVSERDKSMKIMVRRSPETGLCIYVPKKDLEEPIVESEFETLWGGWIKIANGWVLELPDLAADTRLPITVEARKRNEEEKA
jgi:nitrogen fixation protein NifT